jgi:hypothetical protein
LRNHSDFFIEHLKVKYQDVEIGLNLSSEPKESILRMGQEIGWSTAGDDHSPNLKGSLFEARDSITGSTEVTRLIKAERVSTRELQKPIKISFDPA